MGEISVTCKNGKSRAVGGVLSEIPFVVGVWIFSGTTHFRILRALHNLSEGKERRKNANSRVTFLHYHELVGHV